MGCADPWGDQSMATGVTCAKLQPHPFPLPSGGGGDGVRSSAAVNFPRYWRETDQTDPKRYNRGTAWFFLPSVRRGPVVCPDSRQSWMNQLELMEIWHWQCCTSVAAITRYFVTHSPSLSLSL